MKTHKIAVIAGDGIGPEVLAEGVRVLKQVAECDGGFSFEFTYFPWGCEYYLKTGKMMDEDGSGKLKQFDAIFLGAVGYPGVPDHISCLLYTSSEKKNTIFCFCFMTSSISQTTVPLSRPIPSPPLR